MPPNPRVVAAYRAMKAMGIHEDTTKPVLKNLFKLYDKNWELIEEENYRALADAIFEYEETKEAEQKKKIDNANQEEELEKDDQVNDESERPLKRLRLKHQDGQISSGSELITPKLEPGVVPESSKTTVGNDAVDAQTGSAIPEADASQLRLRNKGKEPLVPQDSPGKKRKICERSPRPLRIEEPKLDPIPRQNVADTKQSVRPDEPFADGARSVIPIAVIHPDRSPKGAPSVRNNSVPSNSADETRTNREPKSVVEDSPCKLEIASSALGDVKISLSCNTAARLDFHVPKLEAVLKKVEEKCVGLYNITDPAFSVTKLMRDMCDCFLEMGTETNGKIEERPKSSI